jgi:hypothetical protein
VCTPPPTLDVSGHVRVVVNALRSPVTNDNYLMISSGAGKVIVPCSMQVKHSHGG